MSDVRVYSRGLKVAPDIARMALGAALYTAASELMTEAQELAPVDTGALRRSAYVQPPQDAPGGELVVEVGFGGEASEYALIQHERTDFRHDVGQAKFLEEPFENVRNKIVRNALISAKHAVESGVAPDLSTVYPREPGGV